MNGRFVSRYVLGAAPGAPRRTFRAIENAVLKLPLPENKVAAPERALDHLAESAESFALAVFFLRWSKAGGWAGGRAGGGRGGGRWRWAQKVCLSDHGVGGWTGNIAL